MCQPRWPAWSAAPSPLLISRRIGRRRCAWPCRSAPATLPLPTCCAGWPAAQLVEQHTDQVDWLAVDLGDGRQPGEHDPRFGTAEHAQAVPAHQVGDLLAPGLTTPAVDAQVGGFGANLARDVGQHRRGRYLARIE